MTTVLSERRKWERGRQRPRCFKSSFRIINIWAKTTTTTTATHFELCMTDRRKWSETKTSSRTHSQIWKPNWWKCAKERRAKEEKRKKWVKWMVMGNGNGKKEKPSILNLSCACMMMMMMICVCGARGFDVEATMSTDDDYYDIWKMMMQKC